MMKVYKSGSIIKRHAVLRLGAVLFGMGFLGCGPSVEELNNEALALLEERALGPAETKLREAVELAPDDCRLHANLAEVLLLSGRVEEAVDEQRLAVHLDKTGAPRFRRRYAEIQLRLNRPSRAVETLEDLVGEFPQDTRAKHLLFHTYLTLNRNEEAEILVAEGLKRTPHSPALLTARALLLDRKGDSDGAVESLEAALEICREEPGNGATDPDCLEAHRALGDIHYRQKRYRAAAEQYRACLAGGENPLCEIKLAKCYLGMGDPERALASFGPREDRIDSFEGLVTQARAYFALEEWEEARDACSRALWIKPQDTEVRNLRGVIHGKLRQTAYMLEDFETSLKQNPNQPDVRALLESYDVGDGTDEENS